MIYTTGSYSKSNEIEQWIRITDGCVNNCEYCYCPTELKIFGIPEIIRNKVKIMDMNLLSQPFCKEIIKKLGSKKVNNKTVYYELICGVDYRFLTQEISDLLKENHFINIRFAWDYSFTQQKLIKRCYNFLLKSGYKPKTLSCFVLCDWKNSYEDNLKKLDLLKVWNVKINDCWYDNTVSPNFQCNYWNLEQCKSFRSKCRKHNQLVLFGLDPELKEVEKQ